MVSLATTHSPADLHLYVLDLAGRNFRSLEGFARCGGVIYADEETFEERMHRRLERLTDLIEERQAVFAASGAIGVYDYNQRFPESALPAVLVVIDNVINMHQNYRNLVDNTIIPLVRRSPGSGVTFAISANGPSALHRLGPLFGTQIPFRQSKPDVYPDIVGRGAVELGDIPGPRLHPARMSCRAVDAHVRHVRSDYSWRLQAESGAQLSRLHRRSADAQRNRVRYWQSRVKRAPVWRAQLRSGLAVNRQFLQSALERGVPLALRGATARRLSVTGSRQLQVWKSAIYSNTPTNTNTNTSRSATHGSRPGRGEPRRQVARSEQASVGQVNS